MDRGLRQTELKDSYSVAFATDAELADILRKKSRDWAGARIVSSIPGNKFSQRTVTFPFSDRKRVEKALPFELEDSIPFSLDDVELDHLLLDRTEPGAEKKKESSVLGIMLPKTVLRQHLELLGSAGVDPQVILPSYAGLSCIAKLIPVEGAAILVDGSDLCLKIGNNVTACRSFSPSHNRRDQAYDKGARDRAGNADREGLPSFRKQRQRCRTCRTGDRCRAGDSGLRGEKARRSGEPRSCALRSDQLPQGRVRIPVGGYGRPQGGGNSSSPERLPRSSSQTSA